MEQFEFVNSKTDYFAIKLEYSYEDNLKSNTELNSLFQNISFQTDNNCWHFRSSSIFRKLKVYDRTNDKVKCKYWLIQINDEMILDKLHIVKVNAIVAHLIKSHYDFCWKQK